MPPRYEILASEGPDHAKIFFVGVFVGDKMISSASGKSKQDAETESAIIALTWLKENPNVQVTAPDLAQNTATEILQPINNIQANTETPNIPRIVVK